MVLELVRNKIYLTRVCVNDLLAGMTLDLDVLIQSNANPLVTLECHWQFSYSLIRIWVGAPHCILTYCSSLYALLKGVTHRCQLVTRKLGIDDTAIG